MNIRNNCLFGRKGKGDERCRDKPSAVNRSLPDRPTPNRPPRRSAPPWLKKRHHAQSEDAVDARRGGRMPNGRGGCHRRATQSRGEQLEEIVAQPHVLKVAVAEPPPRRLDLRLREAHHGELRSPPDAKRMRAEDGARVAELTIDHSMKPSRPWYGSGASRERPAAASLPLPRNPPRRAR